MELSQYFKSIIDQDSAQIVICNLDHVIIYMNPAAVSVYGKHGGAALVGKSLLTCHDPESVEKIQKVVDWFAASPDHNLVFTAHHDKNNEDIYMVALRNETGELIGYYEKHEGRDPETARRYQGMV